VVLTGTPSGNNRYTPENNREGNLERKQKKWALARESAHYMVEIWYNLSISV
jgi:hypothetical protein